MDSDLVEMGRFWVQLSVLEPRAKLIIRIVI
jgi:hypothetical protein